MENVVAKKNITIAGVNLNEFNIIYQDTQVAKRAAEELEEYLFLTIGVRLEKFKDSQKDASEHEILVGITNRESEFRIDRSAFKGAAEDSLVIAVKEGNLYLTGGNGRGTLYAVYEFLEKYIGWRFFTIDCEVLKGETEINIPEGLFECQKSMLEHRDTRFADYAAIQIRAKRKLNKGSFDESWGGSFDYSGNSCHSIQDICGLNNATEQPCFTDPETLKKSVEYVRKIVAENPGARIISITQNDNYNYCKCERCQKVVEEEGSLSGPVIRMVNQVADTIKDEFPDLSIDTFAYQWTRKAPKKSRMSDNVMVRLCTGTECRSHAYSDASCRFNTNIETDISEWNRLTNRIYVWDYVTNFSYYLVPFANFEHLLENAKWLYEHGMSGLISQGNTHCANTEFGPLRAYLISKIQWNLNMSKEEYYAHMDDFCESYYGAGWKYIRKFIDFIQECSKNRHVKIYCRPEYILNRKKYIAKINEIEEWFDEAEKSALPGQQRDRVYRLRLSHVFAKLWFTFDDEFAKGGDAKRAVVEEHKKYYFAMRAFKLDPAEGRPVPPEDIDFEKGVKSWYEPFEWEKLGEYIEDGEEL